MKQILIEAFEQIKIQKEKDKSKFKKHIHKNDCIPADPIYKKIPLSGYKNIRLIMNIDRFSSFYEFERYLNSINEQFGIQNGGKKDKNRYVIYAVSTNNKNIFLDVTGGIQNLPIKKPRVKVSCLDLSSFRVLMNIKETKVDIVFNERFKFLCKEALKNDESDKAAIVREVAHLLEVIAVYISTSSQ